MVRALISNLEIPGSIPPACHWMDLSSVAPNSNPTRFLKPLPNKNCRFIKVSVIFRQNKPSESNDHTTQPRDLARTCTFTQPITRGVAAMGRCFGLVGPHQQAHSPRSHTKSSTPPLISEENPKVSLNPSPICIHMGLGFKATFGPICIHMGAVVGTVQQSRQCVRRYGSPEEIACDNKKCHN